MEIAKVGSNSFVESLQDVPEEQRGGEKSISRGPQLSVRDAERISTLYTAADDNPRASTGMSTVGRIGFVIGNVLANVFSVGIYGIVQACFYKSAVKAAQNRLVTNDSTGLVDLARGKYDSAAISKLSFGRKTSMNRLNALCADAIDNLKSTDEEAKAASVKLFNDLKQTCSSDPGKGMTAERFDRLVNGYRDTLVGYAQVSLLDLREQWGSLSDEEVVRAAYQKAFEAMVKFGVGTTKFETWERRKVSQQCPRAVGDFFDKVVETVELKYAERPNGRSTADLKKALDNLAAIFEDKIKDPNWGELQAEGFIGTHRHFVGVSPDRKDRRDVIDDFIRTLADGSLQQKIKDNNEAIAKIRELDDKISLLPDNADTRSLKDLIDEETRGYANKSFAALVNQMGSPREYAEFSFIRLKYELLLAKADPANETKNDTAVIMMAFNKVRAAENQENQGFELNNGKKFADNLKIREEVFFSLVDQFIESKDKVGMDNLKSVDDFNKFVADTMKDIQNGSHMANELMEFVNSLNADQLKTVMESNVDFKALFKELGIRGGTGIQSQIDASYDKNFPAKGSNEVDVVQKIIKLNQKLAVPLGGSVDLDRLNWLADKFCEGNADVSAEAIKSGTYKPKTENVSEWSPIESRAYELCLAIKLARNLKKMKSMLADKNVTYKDMNDFLAESIGTTTHADNNGCKTDRARKDYIYNLSLQCIRIMSQAIATIREVDDPDPKVVSETVDKLIAGNSGTCLEKRNDNLQVSLYGSGDDSKTVFDLAKEVYEGTLKDARAKMEEALRRYYQDDLNDRTKDLPDQEVYDLLVDSYKTNPKGMGESNYSYIMLGDVLEAVKEKFNSNLLMRLEGKRGEIPSLVAPAEEDGNWTVNYKGVNSDNLLQETVNLKYVEEQGNLWFDFLAEDVLIIGNFVNVYQPIADERVDLRKMNLTDYDYEKEMRGLAEKMLVVDDNGNQALTDERFVADVNGEIAKFRLGSGDEFKISDDELKNAVIEELRLLKDPNTKYKDHYRSFVDADFMDLLSNRDRLLRIVAGRVFDSKSAPDVRFRKNLMASAYKVARYVNHDFNLSDYNEGKLDNIEFAKKIANALNSFYDSIRRMGEHPEQFPDVDVNAWQTTRKAIMDEDGTINASKFIFGNEKVIDNHIENRIGYMLEVISKLRHWNNPRLRVF